MKRVILHVDMNSYFASVAQNNNLEYRDKPIAVMGKGKGTVVIAASKEAKLYGIKTGTTKSEAIKLYPDIKFVDPDFSAYVHVTSQLMEIFHSFTEIVEPFSIDEAFLDITNTYEIKKGLHPIDFALVLKKVIRDKLGDVISCSVGIADNKLMAKFGSDLKKPDGLVYLTPDQYTSVLDKYPLGDICGIGYRTLKRLNRLNINSISDLRNTDYKILLKEFGRVQGRFLYLCSRGLDYHKVDSTRYFTDPKSISHSETFIENKSSEKLYSEIYKLTEKVCLKLRKKKLFTGAVSIYIKDKNFIGYSYGSSFLISTNNTLEIYSTIIKKIPKDFIARFVCVAAYELSNIRNESLFSENDKKDGLQNAMDKINKKFGNFCILPANLSKPEATLENNIEVPFSGFDLDAKLGMDMTAILRKDLQIIKNRIGTPLKKT